MVKKLIIRVAPGVDDTLARLRRPTNMLSRDDFPTFERPMKANSGIRSGGQPSRSVALVPNSAVLIFTPRNCTLRRGASSALDLPPERKEDQMFYRPGREGFETRMAERLQAGTVWINSHAMYDASLPIGGMKQSGYGRESGQAAMDNYLELKTVCAIV